MRTVHTTSADETREFGRELARDLRPGDVVTLDGELGAGKTQLAKGIAAGLGVTAELTSPTYAICETYPIPPRPAPEAAPGPAPAPSPEVPPESAAAPAAPLAPAPELNHLDLYRLDDASQLDDIGFYETLESGGISLIEWARKFPDAIPPAHIEVAISVLADGTREISITRS